MRQPADGQRGEGRERPQNTTVPTMSDERLLSGLMVVMVFGRVASEQRWLGRLDRSRGFDPCAGSPSTRA